MLEKDDVVPDVSVVVCIGRVDIAGVGCKARGADAGSAGQGVDFEAGVVGDDKLARCELGVVDGFDCGVFGEGLAIFFGRLDFIEIGEWIDGDGVRFGGGAEVAQFALAGGGYEEVKGHPSKFNGREFRGDSQCLPLVRSKDASFPVSQEQTWVTCGSCCLENRFAQLQRST